MRKIGLFIIAIVLALGALGTGYAFMTQDIHVNAAVETGYVQASFTNVYPGPTFADLGTTSTGVAWYTESLDTSNGGYLGDTLEVTLSNAYPGMTAVIPVQLKNTGSLPIGQIGGVATAINLPTDSEDNVSTVVLTAAPGYTLEGELAVGSTMNALITVAVPFGASSNDPVFAQNNTTSYGFNMTITSTQFAPEKQFVVNGTGTGVNSGTVAGAP
jgi:hypothetical protein